MRFKAKSKQSAKKEITPHAKELFSKFEKRMFQMLRICCPNCHIFCQVSFAALLDVDIPHFFKLEQKYKIRSKFDKKIADFVLTDKTLKVVCIIELDDITHQNQDKKNKDAERDQMLQNAGYKTLRYYHLPKINQIKTDIAQILETA